MVHDLKAWPPYFAEVETFRKTFEVRAADRPFRVGDVLRLREWDPATEEFSGRECCRAVTYLLRDGDHAGVASGYVVMGLGLVVAEKTARG